MAAGEGRGGITRRAMVGAGIAALALPLTACSTPAAAGLAGSALDPRTLVFWNLFGGGDGSRMQAMEAGYQKTHGGLRSLQSTTFAWGNPYYSKLTLATVGHKPPDVAIAHLTRAKLLAAGDVIEPITDADLASVGLSASDFSTRAWNFQRTEGKNIAIPLDTHPLVMFFNVDVCKKAGLLDSNDKLKPIHGLAEFESALKAVSKVTGGAAITSANVAEFATPWRVFQTLYNQRTGATPFLGKGGGEITVNDDLAVDTLSTVAKWAKNGWLAKALTYADAETAMFTGKAGFYLEGEWEVTTAQSVKGLKFGMAPVPTIYDKPAAQADSHTFVLPKKDRTPAQRKQAMGFIKSMLDQSMTWAEGGHVPGYTPFRDSAAYKKLQPQSDYASAADGAIYDPEAWYSGSGSTFENVVGSQMALVQQGAISPGSAMSAIRSQLKVYLSTKSPL